MTRPATALALLLASTAAAAEPPLLMKRYTVRDVELNDRQPLVELLIPKGWKATSEVKWTLASVMAPHSYWAKFTAPDDSAAVEFLPVMMGQFHCSSYGQQGNPEPKDVIDGLLRVAKAVRPNTKLKVRAKDSNKKTSSTIKAANGGESTVTEQTGTVVVVYTIDGREFEEEFAGSVYIVETVQGDLTTRNWFVHDLRAIRADEGNLAEVRPVGVAVARSARPTPEFLLAIEFAKKEVARVWQRGRELDRIDAELWRRTREEISDTWRKTTEERWVQRQKHHEQMQDLLGGVTRYTSDNGYEVTLPQSHSYAWEGPNDTFLLTNDPSYRPDVHFRGDWARLKAKK
jgi:hypothetical protein